MSKHVADVYKKVGEVHRKSTPVWPWLVVGFIVITILLSR